VNKYVRAGVVSINLCLTQFSNGLLPYELFYIEGKAETRKLIWVNLKTVRYPHMGCSKQMFEDFGSDYTDYNLYCVGSKDGKQWININSWFFLDLKTGKKVELDYGYDDEDRNTHNDPFLKDIQFLVATNPTILTKFVISKVQELLSS
jgi:hypothetical protein